MNLMVDQINNFTELDENDKNILKEFIVLRDINKVKNMSIFSKLGEYKIIDDYEYFETIDNEDFFYLNCNINLSIFIDKNKKILFDSRFFKSFPDLLINHLFHIFTCLKNINLKNVENIINIENNIISIEKWFITYGHFIDEIFNLYDFYTKINNNNLNYLPLIDYIVDSKTLNYSTKNYEIIQKYLFDDNIINANTYGKSILKIKKVFLISNTFINKTFHSFPINSSNKLISSITNYNLNYKNIFITRNNSEHRNLSNLNELEEYFKSINYIILNPENISYELFINSIKNSQNVFITWGSALVNLVYLKENTNVYILKSTSYLHENIELFQKMINKHKLNINIINVNNDNKIDIQHLSQYNLS